MDQEFIVYCDRCNKLLDQLKNEDIFIDAFTFDVDYSIILCAECFDKDDSISFSE